METDFEAVIETDKNSTLKHARKSSYSVQVQQQEAQQTGFIQRNRALLFHYANFVVSTMLVFLQHFHLTPSACLMQEPENNKGLSERPSSSFASPARLCLGSFQADPDSAAAFSKFFMNLASSNSGILPYRKGRQIHSPAGSKYYRSLSAAELSKWHPQRSWTEIANPTTGWKGP